MGKKRIMVGVAETTDEHFTPYYATIDPKGLPIGRIALSLARQCFSGKKFVYMAFPEKTRWKDADKKLQPIWEKYREK